MASRIIHLTIAELICRQADIGNKQRFFMGSIIPDAKMDRVLRNGPHFLRSLPDGRLCYGLKEFLGLYGDKLAGDELYLGYYLHLIQDTEYRRYMYMERGLNALSPGNVDRLYGDYRNINRYLIQKYGLENPMFSPADFENVDVCRRFEFDLPAFLGELGGDFLCRDTGEYVFFTPEYTEEFIDRAFRVCMEELEALAKGRTLYDEEEKAWDGNKGT